MTSIEYLQLDSQDQTQPHLGLYHFDVRPELAEGHSAFAFKVSDCLSRGTSPTAPGWVGAFGTEDEYDEDAPIPHVVVIADTEDRPAGLPLRVRARLPFLDPRYGDAWVAFILPNAEEEE